MLTPIWNEPRDYAWGSTTLLADLQGRVPDGRPEAEIWFGDHPGSPSRLVGDAQTLVGDAQTLDVLRADAGRPRLPFLLKLLAAGSPLSIQAHPSRSQAREGFAREEAAGIPRDASERTYRDENHKPELIVAVSEHFLALAGLRPLADTRRLLAALPSGEGVERLRALLADGDESAALRAAISWLLSEASPAAIGQLTDALTSASAPDFARELAELRRIAQAYPGDAGVAVAMLMNLVVLRRGEAVFVDAGVLHAYVEGLGVELMAASDNVLRGGLTPKHIDVAELLRIVDTTPGPAPVLHPHPAVDGVRRFDPGVGDFALLHVRVSGSESVEVEIEGAAIAVSTTGGVHVAASDAAVTLAAGAAVYADGERMLRVDGDGELFVAFRPSDTP